MSNQSVKKAVDLWVERNPGVDARIIVATRVKGKFRDRSRTCLWRVLGGDAEKLRRYSIQDDHLPEYVIKASDKTLYQKPECGFWRWGFDCPDQPVEEDGTPTRPIGQLY